MSAGGDAQRTRARGPEHPPGRRGPGPGREDRPPTRLRPGPPPPRPRLALDALAAAARAPVHLHPEPSSANDAWFVLTGCRKGPVPRALVEDGPAAAARQLHSLVEAFGSNRVLVELWDHGDPLDRPRNDPVATLAPQAGAGIVATNN